MEKAISKSTAKLMLFTAALIWGATFVITKNSLDDTQPFFLTAMRFSIGSLAMLPFLWKKRKLINRDMLIAGALIGFNLFAGFAAQAIGLLTTTPSKNAFLSSCYSALVPLLAWLLLRRKPDRWQAFAALLCIIGVGIISLEGDLSFRRGDVISFIAAIFYAGQFIALEKFGAGKDVYLISMIEFGFAGLYAWILSFLTEGMPQFTGISPYSWFSIFYLGVLSSSVAFLFQNVGQRYTDASSSSLILSLECVFGTIIAVLFYGDRLTLKLSIGFTVVFLAILCSETKFAFLRKKGVSRP